MRFFWSHVVCELWTTAITARPMSHKSLFLLLSPAACSCFHGGQEFHKFRVFPRELGQSCPNVQAFQTFPHSLNMKNSSFVYIDKVRHQFICSRLCPCGIYIPWTLVFGTRVIPSHPSTPQFGKVFLNFVSSDFNRRLPTVVRPECLMYSITPIYSVTSLYRLHLFHSITTALHLSDSITHFYSV